MPTDRPEAVAHAPLPQETIRRKRDGLALGSAEIRAFVDGIAHGRVADAQSAAFAMAVCWRGMNRHECVALTLAMRDSGQCLRWPALPGPVLDKHSTGGVGDTVSLVLGPLLAACGGFVPMISGRGLGHTGGTLDKLEAIPGYTLRPQLAQLRRVVRTAGIAIVGAGARLAPADRRLYAVRDITATIDSVPLITASILSKKLAAGLGSLVLDVKFGNGAFMPDLDRASALARSLVEVGNGAGLPTRALLTDMNQPLASAAGNALEVHLAVDLLTGRARQARLRDVVLALGAVALCQAGLADTAHAARQRLQQALDSGAGAERFARMVAGLGGPADLIEQPARYLARAPVQRAVHAAVPERHVAAVDTRALGLVVLQLGGGRHHAQAHIDPAVGLSDLAPLGAELADDMPLAVVHAANEAAAEQAATAVRAAYVLAEQAPPLDAGAPLVRTLPELSQ
jgi:thymidine phosphorylase